MFRINISQFLSVQIFNIFSFKNLISKINFWTLAIEALDILSSMQSELEFCDGPLLSF